MKLKAYAKINLSLDVKGKRKDGYHELDMIMVPIDLYDLVNIELATEDRFTCNVEGLAMDSSNTVVKAVTLMREVYHLDQKFHIHVEKNIPAQAGLAGGSSDGAAVMRGIRELCKLDVPIEELVMLSKQVGADVPFCVMAKSAVVQGIGEYITPFDVHCDFDILLVKPPMGVSTQQAFSMLDFSECPHPSSTLVRKCLEEDRFEELAHCMGNSLEYSAFQLVSDIAKIKTELSVAGFEVVLCPEVGVRCLP
ncbi:4-(cytidine 5'-diphospho)-2-C-methyl-D-erythritol kinase [Amedibacillus dolichus]|uniref:4-(cytidine 5'-diphospho)-2-C-methyl-D-erythritol kinase n=1 Tax=Amedibacillus dolichus TaxID=31971 RepID=UPI0021752CF5|nr:4-(cytidine 5'-diphospho)-2-C-methyl-D-erythritol kinase [Amedibacillus dolichus]